MRVAIDATPAAVQRGGVGRYARELLRALVAETLDHQFILSLAASEQEAADLQSFLPPGAWREVRRLPVSERAMTALWQRARVPVAIGRWIGEHDLYHGTDFVLPPTPARTVVTIHDLSFHRYPEYSHPELAAYLKAAVPRSIQRADAIITVSASVAAEVATAYPEARQKLIAIPNGVSAPESRVRTTSSDLPTVLMVGTIEPRKNHLTVIRAVQSLRTQCAEARLVIVGRRGWMDDEIIAEISRGQDAGWITWMKNAGDAELEREYDRASVFVAGSHYEGFGLPVLEALARGIPCVVSDIAAHREVAGDAGQYVPTDNAEAYTAAMLEVIENRELSERLADAGRQRAVAHSWQETARRTLRAYEFAARGGV